MRNTTSWGAIAGNAPWVGLGAALLFGSMAACAASHPPKPVEEVPIDQDTPASGGGEDSSGGGAATTTADRTPGDGTTPQPIGGDDAGSAEEADGSEATAFKQRPGGLSLKQCTDMVMHLARLTGKETKETVPKEKELAQHPIYGQMLQQCGGETTRKQYQCAARAHTSAAWRKCMK